MCCLLETAREIKFLKEPTVQKGFDTNKGLGKHSDFAFEEGS